TDDDDIPSDTFTREQSVKVKANFGIYEDVLEDDDNAYQSPNDTVKPQEKPSYSNQAFVKDYQLPPVTLFKKITRNVDAQPQWLLDQIDVINKTLKDHGVEGEVNSSKKGPTVTRYELSLEPGVPVKRVTSIQDNIM